MIDQDRARSLLFKTRGPDPDPYWIRIQSGQWIRIRISFEVLDVLFCDLEASSVTWTDEYYS
jgi:hypothetical protein